MITWPLPTRGFCLPLFGMSTSVREHEDKTVENWGEEELP